MTQNKTKMEGIMLYARASERIEEGDLVEIYQTRNGSFARKARKITPMNQNKEMFQIKQKKLCKKHTDLFSPGQFWIAGCEKEDESDCEMCIEENKEMNNDSKENDSELQRLLGSWISNPNIIQRIIDLVAEEKKKSRNLGRKDIYDLMNKVQGEAWEDEEHCTCLPHAIWRIENNYKEFRREGENYNDLDTDIENNLISKQ